MAAARCTGCGAPILWAHTRNGRRMPVDPWEDPNGNLATHIVAGVLVVRVLVGDQLPHPTEIRRVPHFATCPKRPKRKT